jgi:enoyl-CoA hydratase
VTDLLKVTQDNHILMIGLNRPEKRNALNSEMFRGLSAAYTTLCDDPELRCGVLYSEADLFTSGLDLQDMAPVLLDQEGLRILTEENQVDPFNWASAGARRGRMRTKPVITAINGRCFTAGIELALSTDIVVADENVVFAQTEVRRGLIPLGGAIERFVTRFGWGNAMRYLLSGDSFDAAEALRIGLVQEVVATGGARARAVDLAVRIASAAPIGVRGVLANAIVAQEAGAMAAAEHLRPYVREHISKSQDLMEGMKSVFEKREPAFRGN